MRVAGAATMRDTCVRTMRPKTIADSLTFQTDTQTDTEKLHCRKIKEQTQTNAETALRKRRLHTNRQAQS